MTRKVTSKGRTRISRWVRAVKTNESDEVACSSADNRVMTRASVADDPFATFEEWDGPADRKAYGSL